ncbi:hypothetical protein L873DRAFT_1709954 [Choiromyces venosus 120613-1]|uniref:BIR-domain-containing protein n=1 Tax=Choiromyces venosus 120613-1 TaxID=1336337 RepID=A0A3N4J256_9PEZI|nr:hypothetical protein L873DRAFT_1709954 [Choiromyces venosus 120613-1]
MSKKDMNIHEKRLSSFTRKRRASSAVGNKNAGSGKWPHEQPSPQELADAGFYFNPSDAHLDNVTCYLCDKDLDGWEQDDDPIAEHFKHCPDCGWAQVAYALAFRDDQKALSDPRGAMMTEARIMTFGKKWWPHEEKRGWLPKIETMAEAGWHHAPVKDSKDYTSCAYCDLTLDGWEMNDDPLEEHRRRSQDCLFFTWKPAPKRATKRASRASIQSTVSSIGDEEEPTQKPARGRKGKRAPSVVRELSVDPEPIVIDEPVKAPRGRKRASSIVQNPEPVILWDGSKDTDEEEVQPPPAKRRTTRASLAKQSSVNPEADSKMADSDNESVAAGPARGRPKKGVRSASKTRRPVVKKNSKTFVPDDDEIDRALALDFDRPLTDEEDAATFKKPFVRTNKRLTRSRTSIAVEESMRNAPEGVLIPTARRTDRVSRTPLGTATPGSIRRSPTKALFKDSNQDFSMPIVIPKHLAQADIEEAPGSLRRMGRYDDKVESAPVEVAPAEEPEPKRPATKKVVRGRKVAPPPQEVEAPKPRRGRVVAKAQKPPSRSPSVDRQPPIPAQMEPERPVVEELPPPPARIEEPSEAPLRTKRVRKIKGRASVLSTTSMNSIASDNTGSHLTSSIRSMISDTTGAHNMTSSMRSVASGTTGAHNMTSSMRSMASESEQMATSLDESIIIHDSMTAPEAEAEDAISDAGSVIRYKINPRERQPEEEIAPPPKIKRGKKATAPPKKRPTRSSLLSVATDKTADSVGNSGDETDASRASASGTGKKTKKGSKKLGKKTTQSRNIEDILKKGSESFFAPSQSEELTSSIHEGAKRPRPVKKLMNAIEIEPRNSAKPEDPYQTEEDEPRSVPKGSRPVATGRSVSFSSRTQDPDLYPGSDTEPDEVVPPPASAPAPPPAVAPVSPPRPARRPAAIPHSPTRMPRSPARIPLSPVRTQITVPLASTPKTKPSGKLATVRPWTAVDLDTVFHASEMEIDDDAGLTEKEKEMTVADWVKWNAVQGEEKLCRDAERLIEIFEREGRRAIDAVEGIETV